MQKPKNPIGYTVDELCRMFGCEAGDVSDAIRCKTVGVDRETGDALIYPQDIQDVAAHIAKLRTDATRDIVNRLKSMEWEIRNGNPIE